MNWLQHMPALSDLKLSPMFGWPVAIVVSLVVLGVAVFGLVRCVRQRPDTDATVGGWVRRLLMALVLALMVLTPSVTTVTESRAVNATDVFIAVDVTGSMAVSDAQYGSADKISRIDAARKAVHDITALYPDASFAAVSFGTSGTTDVPLTPDSRAIDNWVDTLPTEPTSVSAGSNLDKAIDPLLLTMKSTKDKHADDQILVYYISDGEQTSNKTRRTFSSLRQYADNAVVVGVGSTQGGRIPQVSDDGTVAKNQWVTDPSTKQPGISKMDVKNLKAIADEMGGSYVQTQASTTLATQQQMDGSSDYRVTVTHKQREHSEPIVWPLALALMVLVVIEVVSWIRTSGRLL